jgi:hypothetical protein
MVGYQRPPDMAAMRITLASSQLSYRNPNYLSIDPFQLGSRTERPDREARSVIRINAEGSHNGGSVRGARIEHRSHNVSRSGRPLCFLPTRPGRRPGWMCVAPATRLDMSAPDRWTGGPQPDGTYAVGQGVTVNDNRLKPRSCSSPCLPGWRSRASATRTSAMPA